MTDTFVDRMAKAMYELNPAYKAMYPPIPIPWDKASGFHRDAQKRVAIAALKAMRELPSGFRDIVDPNYDRDWWFEEAFEHGWQAMIDRAIKEGE